MIDSEACCNENDLCKPVLAPLIKKQAGNKKSGTNGKTAIPALPLTEDQLLMTSAYVHGFDLKSKEWCRFPVSGITDIVFNPLAFDALVLPDSEKKLAWAFVESKKNLGGAGKDEDEFDDFVADKGRGLTMLLCGPPGVGKTFPAEAIAERAESPLYILSAGELGTEPSNVDAALDKALDMCRRWKAMLLLDEADVFLGKRFGGQEASILRNELVSSKSNFSPFDFTLSSSAQSSQKSKKY